MGKITYKDFKLLIEPFGEKYKARVESPVGEATTEFSLPFTKTELENFVLKIGRPRRGVRSRDSLEMKAAKGFGGRLFEAVFSQGVRDCLHGSLIITEHEEVGLRILLRLTDAYELAYLLQKRELHHIPQAVEKGCKFAEKLELPIWKIRIWAMDAKAKIILKDLAGSKAALEQAKRIVDDHQWHFPFFFSDYFITKFDLELNELEADFQFSAAPKSKAISGETVTRLRESAREAIKKAKKCPDKMPEALRLKGILYWLENKQWRACRQWKKSIKFAEQIGARPELARTYVEVGKRLLEKKSKYQRLNDMGAEEFLNEAEILFKEMGLQWDLEELERIKNQLQYHA